MSLDKILEGSIITSAENLARDKHKHQKRAFTGEPYFNHPYRVALYAQAYKLSNDCICAAYLHDTIEDTDVTYSDLLKMFGKHIADLVQELTSDTEQIKNIGKTLYLINKMNDMSDQAFTIKLLDRLDNVSDFDNAPDKFVKKYSKATKEIISKIVPRTALHDALIAEIKKKIMPHYNRHWLTMS